MVFLLLNCTWASLPEAQQSQSTDTGLWWRKARCLWHGSKEREWCSTSLPQWLSGKGFSRQPEGARHRVRDQPVGSSLIGWWWVNRVMFCVQSSGLGSTFSWPACSGGSVSVRQRKDMAQNVIYHPWRGTKGPWLCFMAKLLLFCLVWLLSFVSAFSHFSD